MNAHSGKFICLACNRPFDPSSEGATSTMGPTCAKRALFNPSMDQMSMLGEDHVVTPVAPSPVIKSKTNTQKIVPTNLANSHLNAKIAFAELYRIYCGNGSLQYAEDADAKIEELGLNDREHFTLGDPSLPWLEPEHDFSLVIDDEVKIIYLIRVVNEVSTLLEMKFDADGPLMEHKNMIVAHNEAMRAQSLVEDATQLSLF